MGRWTQYKEDASRLPEGFTRIGYDSETQQYQFQDRHGMLYQGEPGEVYGTLIPIADSIARERPEAFEDSALRRPTDLLTSPPSTLKSFQDFLSPDSIATSPISPSSSSTKPKPADRFVSAMKMKGVVTGLRKMTTKKKHAPIVEDSKGPIAEGSGSCSGVGGTVQARGTAHLDREGSAMSNVSAENPKPAGSSSPTEDNVNRVLEWRKDV